MRILLILLFILAQDRPALYVVAARSEVMPGDLFSVTVTQFGEVGPVEFDPGGLQVLTDTLTLPTRYVTMRVTGPARDVRLRAWGAGVEASTVVRVCCRPATWPGHRLYLPVFRH